MIRFWCGDETYMLHDGPTSDGRTYPRLPEGILGRLDDMLIIRGANIHPSAVETVLRQCDGLGAEFQIVVDKKGTMDEMTVRVELAPDVARDTSALLAGGDADAHDRIRKEAEERLSRSLQVRIPVELLDPGTLEPTIFKARRVVDRRRAEPATT